MKEVLIIEDDPLVRTMMRAMLEREAFHAVEAAQASEARSALARQRFDLVLLDLHLGYEDGLQLLRELRATSDVPTIIVTALDNDRDRIVGLDCGDGYDITKPVTLS